MKNTTNKILKEKYSKYIDLALKKCARMSFQEKSKGIWTMPEIVEYLANLPTEEAHICISRTISKILDVKKHHKILIVGGGTGKLGHCILRLNKKWLVTEIDSSNDMVLRANDSAKKEGLNNRFLSVVADVKKIPFKNNSFDLVIAYGVFRYFLPTNQKIAIGEMKRVSLKYVLVAEGKARDTIYDLRKKYCKNCKLKEKSIKMFRVTLFYMLFSIYRNNNKFKKLIDRENRFRPMEVLSNLAGMSDGILYQLIL